MRFTPTARRICLAPALGLVLVTAMSACSSSSSSSSSSASATTSATTSPTGITSASVTPSSPAASPSATAPAGPKAGSPQATAAIKTAWVKFFNAKTPIPQRLALLQDGSKFTSAIGAFSASPMAASITGEVATLKYTSATTAKVTYNLLAGGNPVARAIPGTAVLQDGTWKLGDDVFCGLLSLAKNSGGLKVTIPAACNSVS
jgi:hypothetical protein